MHQMLFMQSGAAGALMVNGQFCGPLEGEGRAFPAAGTAEIYIQLFPFDPECRPLSVAMALERGRITRLEPQEHAFAVVWPGGQIELELRPAGMKEREADNGTQRPDGVLLRYLALRLSGDDRARQLLMPHVQEPEISGYTAAVPLRFAPAGVSERFDERAGLLMPLNQNAAQVNAVLAATVPAGQGRRLIERIEMPG